LLSGRHLLTVSGYTYEYLGPSNFELPSAEVRQQALAPDGPAYRALVFVNQTGISSTAAEKILSYAEGGFPIFVVGTPPQSAISAVENEQDKVTRAIEQLMRQNSIVNVRDQEELVKELERADVLPRAMLRYTKVPCTLIGALPGTRETTSSTSTMTKMRRRSAISLLPRPQPGVRNTNWMHGPETCPSSRTSHDRDHIKSPRGFHW
jgi:hypothetical protein